MQRFQRSRKKGSHVPPSIYVGRPSRWANPYPLSKYTRERSLELYKGWLDANVENAPNFLNALVGHDINCWCGLVDENGKPIVCHGDIIIKKMKKMGLVKD